MKGTPFRKSRYRILLILIIIGLVFTFSEALGLLEPVRNFAQKVAVPLQLVVYQSKQNVENVLATVTEIGSMRDKNSSLSFENTILIAENTKLQELAQENKVLREQLGATSSKNQNLIVAKTIGVSPLASKRLLILDKGEINGVRENMIVVVKNILIGKIFEVFPRSSSVQLISDPDTKISVVTGRKIKGILEGQFGAEALLTNVVQSDTLKVGDLVSTTGEGDFPSGLVIGQIKEVKKVEKELFQKAVVAPFLLPESLSTVFLLDDK